MSRSHDSSKSLMQFSKLPIVLLALSIILTSTAVGTNSWSGGNLLHWNDHHWSDLCTAVGALMIFGVICLCFAFLLGIYWTIYFDMGGYMLLSFYIGLYLGSISLTIASLVYTTVISKAWSFILANLAWMLGVLVIWLELPMLPNASC